MKDYERVFRKEAEFEAKVEQIFENVRDFFTALGGVVFIWFFLVVILA